MASPQRLMWRAGAAGAAGRARLLPPATCGATPLSRAPWPTHKPNARLVAETQCLQPGAVNPKPVMRGGAADVPSLQSEIAWVVADGRTFGVLKYLPNPASPEPSAPLSSRRCTISTSIALGVAAGGPAAAGPPTKEHGGGQAACELTDHQLLRSVARRRGVQGQTASAQSPRYPMTRSFFCRSGQATRSWRRRPPGLAPPAGGGVLL